MKRISTKVQFSVSTALADRDTRTRAYAVVREASQAGNTVEFKSLPVLEMVLGLVLVILSIKISAGNESSLGRTAALFCLCGLITVYGIKRNPYTPFYVYAFVMPIFAALGTSVALVLGGTFAIFLHRDRLGWRWQFSWVGAAFCLWVLASVTWAERHYFEQDSYFVASLPAVVVAIVISGIRDPLFRRNLVLLVIGACVVGSLGSLRNWLQGTGEYRGGMSVFSLISPDIFSAWGIFGLIGALVWLLAGRPGAWLRLILIGSVPLILLGIGLCGYRAAIVAGALGVVLVGLCQKRYLQGILIVGAIVAASGLLYLVDPDMFSPVLSRFQTIQEDRGSERLDIWEGAMKVFADHRIIGVGCDNFKFAVSRYFGKELMAHSIYVGTLVEQGIVGFAIMLCWCGVLLRKTWGAQDRVWVFPLLVAFLVQAAFLHEFYYSCFWLVLGLAEGARPGKGGADSTLESAARAFHPRPSSHDHSQPPFDGMRANCRAKKRRPARPIKRTWR